MHKKAKRIVSILVSTTILVTTLFYSLNIMAALPEIIDESNDNSQISIVTERKDVTNCNVLTVDGFVMDLNKESKDYLSKKDKKVISTQINVVRANNINNLNDKFILVDETTSTNESVKKAITEKFNTGARIAIMKKGEKVDNIVDYFGIDKTILSTVAIGADDTDSLKCIGYIVFKKDNIGVIGVIRSEQYNDEKECKNAMIFGLKSRFYERKMAPKTLSTQSLNIFKTNNAYAESTGWTTIDTVQSYSVDDYTGGTVSFSMQLRKYPSNPTPDGKYWFANDVKTESAGKILPVPYSAYQRYQVWVKQIRVNMSANGAGIVYDYAPKKTYGITSTSASLNAGYNTGYGAIGFTYTPSSATDVDVVNLTGRGYTWVGLIFKPQTNWYGGNICSRLIADGITEFWQDTTNCYKNGFTPYPYYYQAKMSYTATFIKYQNAEVNCTNSSMRIASGY